jgi:hypothetical protein
LRRRHRISLRRINVARASFAISRTSMALDLHRKTLAMRPTQLAEPHLSRILLEACRLVRRRPLSRMRLACSPWHDVRRCPVSGMWSLSLFIVNHDPRGSIARSENDRPLSRRLHRSDNRRASRMVSILAARSRISLISCCSERPLMRARAFRRWTVLGSRPRMRIEGTLSFSTLRSHPFPAGGLDRRGPNHA